MRRRLRALRNSLNIALGRLAKEPSDPSPSRGAWDERKGEKAGKAGKAMAEGTFCPRKEVNSRLSQFPAAPMSSRMARWW